MRRKINLFSVQQTPAEINLSPMIDVVFLLLIFFIITTVFVEESGIDVEKAESTTALKKDRQSMQFTLDHKGQIHHAGRQISLASVRGVVNRHLKSTKVPVLIFADQSSTTRQLVKLMDEIKLGGADSISLATESIP